MMEEISNISHHERLLLFMMIFFKFFLTCQSKNEANFIELMKEKENAKLNDQKLVLWLALFADSNGINSMGAAFTAFMDRIVKSL